MQNRRMLANWVEAFLEYTQDAESPTSFRQWAAISTLASVTARKCYLQFGYHQYFMNFWILFVAPPGVCHKSEALGISRDLLETVKSCDITSESITRERMINEMVLAWDKHKASLAETLGDIEAEKLANAAVTVHSSEFGVFLGSSDYRFLNDLTDLYDCKGVWKYGTISHGIIELRNSWLNILGAITPQALRDCLPDFAVGGGFLSRFILVCNDHKEKRVSLTDLTEPNTKLFNAMKDDLNQIAMVSGKFEFTKEAKEVYAKWYRELDDYDVPGGDYRLLHYMMRKPVHLIKTACILSLAKDDTLVVEAEDLSKALDMLNDIETKMSIAYVGMGKGKYTTAMSDIEQILKSVGKISYKHLLGIVRHNVSETEFEEVIKTLVASGIVLRDRTAEEGKITSPRDDYLRLNPNQPNARQYQKRINK